MLSPIAANPMFLCGGDVQSGLYSKQPSLNHLDAGDLFFNVDFRSVYSTLLARWMMAPEPPILGRDFPKLDFV